MEMNKHRIITVILICIVSVAFILTWTYREDLFKKNGKEIRPINVTPKGDTKKSTQLSSQEVLIKNNEFRPNEIEINLEEPDNEDKISKGQIKFTNNGSQGRSVTIQEKEGNIISTFTVPPGSSRRQPFFPDDKGSYIFSISKIQDTGTIIVN